MAPEMRRPTSEEEALAWYHATLADPDTPWPLNEPQCGFFYIVRVKGGPRIPVSVFLEQHIDPDTGELTAPERAVAEIEGSIRPAALYWDRLRIITQAEWEALIRLRTQNPAIFAATNVKADILDMRIRPPKRGI